jgi:general stress protein CsbA
MLSGIALRDSRETTAYTLGVEIDSQNKAYKMAFYARQCLFVCCGGLVISNRWIGYVLAFLLIVANQTFVANPLKPRKGYESEMMWCLWIKLFALTSGVLLLFTRGKITDRNQKIRIGSSSTSNVQVSPAKLKLR